MGSSTALPVLVVGAAARAFLINCYAETASSAQVVNFNPEPGEWSPRRVSAASGLVVSGCQLRSTGAIIADANRAAGRRHHRQERKYSHGNIFENIYLSMRGGHQQRRNFRECV